MKRYYSLSDNPLAEAVWVLMCMIGLSIMFPSHVMLIFWLIVACGIWWFVSSYHWW